MAITEILMIAGIATGLSLVTQIVNKVAVNEKKVDSYKKEIKELTKSMKTLDPKSKEFQETQTKQLDINMKLMKMQFKPMMFTFLPYIILFSFLSSTFAYAPMIVGSSVMVDITGDGTIFSECLNVSAEIKGEFKDSLTIHNEPCIISLNGVNKTLEIDSSDIVKYEIDSLKATISPEKKIYLELPFNLPLLGGKFGWLGTFILFSLASSLILTKALKGKYLRKWD